MVSDFQTMALTSGSDVMNKRVAFAEKLRKAKKSDILKSKRADLQRKLEALDSKGPIEKQEATDAIPASQTKAAEAQAALNMTELF